MCPAIVVLEIVVEVEDVEGEVEDVEVEDVEGVDVVDVEGVDVEEVEGVVVEEVEDEVWALLTPDNSPAAAMSVAMVPATTHDRIRFGRNPITIPP